MKLMVLFLIFFSIAACANSQSKASKQSSAEVQTEEVTYTVDGRKHVGFIAKPADIENEKPAVLVVHEWWGQTDYPRKRARMLAELGYVAMAVDMYGERKVVEHPKDAGAFAKKAMKDSATVKSRFQAAVKTLKEVKGVNSKKLAAIGYCFGGGVVIDAAKQGLDLDAVVSFHGSLQTPSTAKKDAIKAKLLVLNGADDSFVSKEAIASFKKSMDAAGAQYEFVNLKGAVHGFSNPAATANGKKYKLPLAYNKQADEKSWSMMKDFLKKAFQ